MNERNERINFEDINESVDIYALNNALHNLMKNSPIKFVDEDGEIHESSSFEDFDKLMSDKTTTFIL